MTTWMVTGVVHLAALSYAGVSVQQPLRSYRNDVDGMAALLDAMIAAGVTALVYSGSCSVYGTPPVEPVVETTPVAPEKRGVSSAQAGDWPRSAYNRG